jgi:hypothetical protein
MKISPKILNIPPYISTSWKNVDSVYIEIIDKKPVLIIALKTPARTVKIPNLDPKVVEVIFNAHAKFLEEDAPEKVIEKQEQQPPPLNNLLNFGLPLGSGDLQSLGNVMQHNPEQKNAPDLPKEILDKIVGISSMLGKDMPIEIPKAEPHCNCIHCQIARALVGEKKEEEPKNDTTEDVVTEEDLRFRLWDIKQSGDKLYTVSNPLDENEHYQVFLGKPLGCTCGDKNCEHIKAVLKS